MKRTTFMLSVMVTAVIAITALSYQDATASARGICRVDSAFTMAACNCKNCNLDTDNDSGFPPQHSTAQCGNTNNTLVTAWVEASTPSSTWRVVLSKYGRFYQEDWGWGKGEVPTDTVVLSDHDTVTISLVARSTYRINTNGRMTMLPGETANAWIRDIIKVYEKGQEGTPLFSGSITMLPGRYITTGDYYGDPEFTYTPGNPAVLTFHHAEDFYYTGEPSNLVLDVWGPDRGSNVPTITQWGVIVLVALIVASAIYIMLRRRRATVPA
jgi:hypothetical protein